MSVQPDSDLLATLRNNLRRIEEYSDDELTAASLDLKRLLLRRIEIIETAMANLNEIIAKKADQNKKP